MKRWIAALSAGALLVGLSLPVAAQAQNEKPKPGAAQGRRGGGGMKRLQMLLEKLDLTAEQKPKVQELVKSTQAEMQKLPKEERRTKGREIMKGFQQKLNAILTPDQQQKLKEMRRSANKAAAAAKGANGAAKGAKPGKGAGA